ncbi:MAG TPA: AAA family ATPase [Blattabacteriaceae bacterium]
MDFSKLTIKSQEAIQTAQEIARKYNHQSIETSHILKGIFQVDENICPFLLKKLGANPKIVERHLDEAIKKLPKVIGSSRTYFSSQSIKMFIDADFLAKKLNDDFISIEHLIWSLLKIGDYTSQVLKDQGIYERELAKFIDEMRKKDGKVQSQYSERVYNSLYKYANNLNQLAREGILDSVIGRDEEIRRVLHILSRRTKNNPILIGEPGVGKTAIAEGLAHRIINGDIPENLREKQIFSLDMGALIAGAKYKGEFEERLKSLVREVTQSDGRIILFIDEIHTLVSTGGEVAAANILKPALARGELRSIGATTLGEYQKSFEKDKALERRFQKVYVAEPDESSAVSILRGLKEKYENHHKVRIKDEAIIAAVELSQRYIADRFLPDKAIDLIDEAASKLSMEINSKPESIDTIDRKIIHLEIQIEAIKREKDEKKLFVIQKYLKNINKERAILHEQWQGEKDLIERIQKSKENIERFKIEADQSERLGYYSRVAELRYGRIKEEEKKVKNLEKEINKNYHCKKMIQEEVVREDIADVVSKWTGIPLSKMLQSEREKLLNIESKLRKRIIGQENAIKSVSNAIRRSRAGIQYENRPIGSFLFMGSTGIGKTELAKALAEYLFNDENNIVRIDMSEYQESHSVSRLIGSPPGYIGYDEGGQLTERIRRRPYSVILLDEIEKASSDAFNILLQVLEDGRLTDGKGRTVSFKETIIIMTSNIGSEIIKENFDQKMCETIVYTKNKLMELLKRTIRPEFINRIDEIILFKPLFHYEIQKIVQIQLNMINKRLSRRGIFLKITKEATEYLSEKGYDPYFGARPLKREIQNEVLNKLSKEILYGKIVENDIILLDFLKKEGIVFRKQKN